MASDAQIVLEINEMGDPLAALRALMRWSRETMELGTRMERAALDDRTTQEQARELLHLLAENGARVNSLSKSITFLCTSPITGERIASELDGTHVEDAEPWRQFIHAQADLEEVTRMVHRTLSEYPGIRVSAPPPPPVPRPEADLEQGGPALP